MTDRALLNESCVITAHASADLTGIGLLADAARSAAAAYGANADAAGLLVRLIVEDVARRSAGREHGSTAVTLAIEIDGTELALSIDDRAEPLSGPPAGVLTLVDLGLATSAEGQVTGSGNRSEVRVPLPAHGRLFDHDQVDVIAEDVELISAPVTLRPLEPEDAAALTRAIYRCYGWTYPAPDLYFPDRIRAAIESGRRIGEVAMADDGEMASHWGAVAVADGVVETGGTVTDPRFRGRGLAGQLGERLLARLIETGVTGRLREPVLTHPATQHIALREGAHMVGLYLDFTHPLHQVGITDGEPDARQSLTVMYSPLVPMRPATLWIPRDQVPMVRRVLEPTGWPRTLGEVRRAPSVPLLCTVGSAYDALNQIGEVVVPEVGADLIDAVDEAMGQLRRAGAAVIHVRLPATQMPLATVGAGLGSLGLGFAALLPDFGVLGDVLVLQWVREQAVDTSRWAYASDHVAELAAMTLEQNVEVGERADTLRRRDARRQQLFAALPDLENGSA